MDTSFPSVVTFNCVFAPLKLKSDFLFSLHNEVEYVQASLMSHQQIMLHSSMFIRASLLVLLLNWFQ